MYPPSPCIGSTMIPPTGGTPEYGSLIISSILEITSFEMSSLATFGLNLYGYGYGASAAKP
jgi:hypothetical protein